jgi:hypothetical protein
VLKKFNYLLVVCRGTELSFLRLQITSDLNNCVQSGFKPTFNSSLKQLDGNFDMINEDQFKLILKYIAIYKNIIEKYDF